MRLRVRLGIVFHLPQKVLLRLVLSKLPTEVFLCQFVTTRLFDLFLQDFILLLDLLLLPHSRSALAAVDICL